MFVGRGHRVASTEYRDTLSRTELSSRHFYYRIIINLYSFDICIVVYIRLYIYIPYIHILSIYMSQESWKYM